MKNKDQIKLELKKIQKQPTIGNTRYWIGIKDALEWVLDDEKNILLYDEELDGKNTA